MVNTQSSKVIVYFLVHSISFQHHLCLLWYQYKLTTLHSEMLLSLSLQPANNSLKTYKQHYDTLCRHNISLESARMLCILDLQTAWMLSGLFAN